jgi:hypothetical protein
VQPVEGFIGGRVGRHDQRRFQEAPTQATGRIVRQQGTSIIADGPGAVQGNLALATGFFQEFACGALPLGLSSQNDRIEQIEKLLERPDKAKSP